MKVIPVLLLAATFLLAEDKKPEAPKVTQGAAMPTVPEGAKEVAPNLYRYTDAHGKNWMYRKTPFGVSRWEDKPETAVVIENAVPTTATDLGDSVQFQRMTPFGPSRWTRKKSELTDDEKAILAKQPAADSKATTGKASEKSAEKQ